MKKVEARVQQTTANKIRTWPVSKVSTVDKNKLSALEGEVLRLISD